MSLEQILLLVLAAIAAGTINAVVGSGTLITFPLLVAFGTPPQISTMTNSIGQVPGNITGTWGFRRELKGQRTYLISIIGASIAGAAIGCWLLLHLPEGIFEIVVPILLSIAVVLVILQPRIQRWVALRNEVSGDSGQQVRAKQRILLTIGSFAIGIYGGYFTAAQGVLMTALLGVLLPEPMQKITALKNVASLTVNTVAAAVYAAVGFAVINWPAAGILAAGTLIGGLIGSSVGRKLPGWVLRLITVIVGLVAIGLFVWRRFYPA